MLTATTGQQANDDRQGSVANTSRAALTITFSALSLFCVFSLCKWANLHLSLQHVSLQAGAILLGAVGPADRQAVRLPLLLGLAGGSAAPALHRHPSFQTWFNHSLKVQNHRKEGDQMVKKNIIPGGNNLPQSVENIRPQCCSSCIWQLPRVNVWNDKVNVCETECCGGYRLNKPSVGTLDETWGFTGTEPET